MEGESPQERIDALVRTAAEMQREIDVLEAELEAAVRKLAKVHGKGDGQADDAVREVMRRIAAKLANPDEGLSGRMH